MEAEGIRLYPVYAVTTRPWFDRIALLAPARAAFWWPTPLQPHQIDSGERWYFKEEGAQHLLGYGEYAGWERLRIHQLFARYGSASGYNSEAELITAFQALNPAIDVSSEVGNVVLEAFTAFPTPIPLEVLGLENLRQSKFRYLKEGDSIAEYIGGLRGGGAPSKFALQDETAAKHAATMRKHRVGQSAFRRLLLDTYGPICAFTGSKLVEVLQAAHIQPYVNSESDHVANGLLLRADIHILFDQGFLTLDNQLKIVVSPHLSSRELEIVALQGAAPHLSNPRGVSLSPDALRYHRQSIFRT